MFMLYHYVLYIPFIYRNSNEHINSISPLINELHNKKCQLTSQVDQTIRKWI